MIKAAVFSDTHGNIELALEAVSRWRPDIIIHLGDHVRDAREIGQRFPDIPLYSVEGNCDLGSDAPLTDVVPLGAVKAFICHGHSYSVRYSADSLVYAAMEKDCRIAMYGHTHEAVWMTVSGVEVINPGTSGKGREPTWAKLTVSDNGAISCSIEKL